MMKSKLVIMMLSSLLVLSLTACEDVSTGTILDAEEEEKEIQTDEPEEAPETKKFESEGTEEEDSVDETEKTDESKDADGAEDVDKEDTDSKKEFENENSKSATVEGGTNQDDAVSIEVGQEIDGTVSSKQWFSFTTGSDPNPKYQITITNKTASSYRLDVNLKEKSGDDITWTSAYSDGTSASMTADKLNPGTTYDICISPHNDETIDFHMVVLDLNETDNAN